MMKTHIFAITNKLCLSVIYNFPIIFTKPKYHTINIIYQNTYFQSFNQNSLTKYNP